MALEKDTLLHIKYCNTIFKSHSCYNALQKNSTHFLNMNDRDCMGDIFTGYHAKDGKATDG